MVTPFRLAIALGLVLVGCAEEPPPDAVASLPAPAPIASAPVTSSAAPAARVPDLLDRVVLVGASATFGFGARIVATSGPRTLTARVSFGDVLEAAMAPTGPAVVTEYGNFMFFNAPVQMGTQQIEAAARDHPTVLIGVDFLFWFGYGARNRLGGAITDESERLELLEVGLAQLERFDCPIVVSDFPDMSAAIGWMLSAAQVPRPETLTALNARLHAWAAERPHVVVLPFAELMANMRAGAAFTIGGFTWPAGSGSRLLQNDQLHPTVPGLIAVIQLIRVELAARPFGEPATRLDAEPESIVARLRADLIAREAAEYETRPTPPASE